MTSTVMRKEAYSFSGQIFSCICNISWNGTYLCATILQLYMIDDTVENQFSFSSQPGKNKDSEETLGIGRSAFATCLHTTAWDVMNGLNNLTNIQSSFVLVPIC